MSQVSEQSKKKKDRWTQAQSFYVTKITCPIIWYRQEGSTPRKPFLFKNISQES